MTILLTFAAFICSSVQHFLEKRPISGTVYENEVWIFMGGAQSVNLVSIRSKFPP